MKLYLCITLLITLSLISCKKDEDSPKTKTDLLTESTWIFDNQMLDVNYNSKPDDEKGNTKDLRLNFKTDGTLEYTLDNEIQDLTWAFESDESIIEINGLLIENIISSETKYQLLIYQLNASNLIFQSTTVDNPEQLRFEIYKK